MVLSTGVQFILNYKIIRTVLLFLFVVAAFANLIILSSLRTHAHDEAEGVFESVFSIHVHKNLSDNRPPNRIKKPLKKNDEAKILKTSKTTVENEKDVAKSMLEEKKDLGDEETMKLPEETGNMVSPNYCTTWCHRGERLSPPYNLTAVLLVRIYPPDLAGLTSREMLQWLHYLRYAGFQHVYVYDAYVYKSESQEDVLTSLIQSGYVTYIDWSAYNPYTIQGTQVAAYQDCLNRFGKDSKWQAAIDIDEYPFSPSDLEENFMERFLVKYSLNYPDVSEITMKNYLFLGKPLDNETHPLLIDRIRRRTHKPANALVKPIYKPLNVKAAQVHHNYLGKGYSQDSEPELLRMNHYWGARLQNWGEDTPKILEITRPDFSIRPIIYRINNCSKCLGRNSLYVRRWN